MRAILFAIDVEEIFLNDGLGNTDYLLEIEKIISLLEEIKRNLNCEKIHIDIYNRNNIRYNFLDVLELKTKKNQDIILERDAFGSDIGRERYLKSLINLIGIREHMDIEIKMHVFYLSEQLLCDEGITNIWCGYASYSPYTTETNGYNNFIFNNRELHLFDINKITELYTMLKRTIEFIDFSTYDGYAHFNDNNFLRDMNKEITYHKKIHPKIRDNGGVLPF